MFEYICNASRTLIKSCEQYTYKHGPKLKKVNDLYFRREKLDLSIYYPVLLNGNPLK